MHPYFRLLAISAACLLFIIAIGSCNKTEPAPVKKDLADNASTINATSRISFSNASEAKEYYQ